MQHVVRLLQHSGSNSPLQLTRLTVVRHSTTSSNKRWQQRQFRDHFRRAADVQGLKSRAAFKLLEIDAKHRIFAPGQTVFDLGFAPGSWSQVAIERTKPHGRVIGLDILPCQPPKGVSSMQGNFLDVAVREQAKAMVRDYDRGRARTRNIFRVEEEAEEKAEEEEEEEGEGEGDEEDADSEHHAPAEGTQSKEEAHRESKKDGVQIDESIEKMPLRNDQSYIDMERESGIGDQPEVKTSLNGEGTVDVVLSDMSDPWPQMSGFWRRSLSEPYYRLMDTSGIPFRDHAGSMDLCNAALDFALETVKPKGHFICKFYQGGEDKALEKRLKLYFAKVHREKPESSRKESKEAYLVALRRKKLRKPKKPAG